MEEEYGRMRTKLEYVTRARNGRTQEGGGGLTAPKRNENERNSARETYRRHRWCNEAGASFNTDPSSDERQMHLNVVKCSN
ncbi:hypothetical protein TNCV_1986941 [Trichonephila clavipes]|nr:hypothetical protein TNCV_1986941 [Trichonephila clavipes]